MQAHLGAMSATALVCAVAGMGVPRLIAAIPEPAPPAPGEATSELRVKKRYADVAARPRLRLCTALACAVAGAVIGASLGWSWPLLWLLPVVPVGVALAVIDWTTWYLPKRIVMPTYGLTIALVCAGALAARDPKVVLWAVCGWAALAAYYGLIWLISPRSLAYGDVRLAALLGLALGPLGTTTVLWSVFLAALAAGAVILPMRLAGHSQGRRAPYGPFLVAGALAAIVVGQLAS